MPVHAPLVLARPAPLVLAFAARTALLVLPWLATPALAQVYGSLANFDAVNDTGHTAHGFEIRIEDASFHRSSITSVFGLDRDFGVPPSSVVRYGAPTITELPGVGVTIRYAASFANGVWSTGTPTGPYANPGDSCWPFGNALYASGVLSCDHFGVATFGTPARTTYSWLVDPGNTGALTPVSAAIPDVQFIFQPPAPGDVQAVRRVEARIEAEDEDHDEDTYGTPYWVKIYARHLDHRVGHVQDLVKGHDDVPGEDDVEVEWEIFQSGENTGIKLHGMDLAAADEALVLRYEFYRYQGELDADGQALCGRRNRGGDGGTPELCGGLGLYVGAQIAGFNVVQPPLPAVPEPAAASLLLSGLSALGLMARRRYSFRHG